MQVVSFTNKEKQLITFLWCMKEKYPGTTRNALRIPKYVLIFIFSNCIDYSFYDSLILQGEQVEQVLAWIKEEYAQEQNAKEQRKTSTHLLYRGTKDGFEASTFHQLCDYKENTVTLVKTVNDCVFGGFTPLTWEDEGNRGADPKDDEHAFIFSLINPSKEPTKFYRKDKNEFNLATCTSNYCCKHFGPTFGAAIDGGFEFHVADKANETNKSHSDLS